MTVRIDPARVAVVLKGTRHPENIGAAARAMHNMGLGELILVAPENLERDKALKLATHGAAPIFNRAPVMPDLQSALAPFGYVVGTTARQGGERQQIVTPAQMASRLLAIAPRNRIAVLFGPEDRGLTNAELRLCHGLVTIPTAAFSSLNLAQAVMILCYEIFRAGAEQAPPAMPRLATRFEQDGMYDQLREVLLRISFIQPDNPDYWMSRLRRFFTRHQLRAADVRIIRGICRQIDWYGGHRYRQGLAAGAAQPSDPVSEDRPTER
jgi:tRNA/rRNA methyltransferase